VHVNDERYWFLAIFCFQISGVQPYTYITSTSHHIEETDAGSDRPLYLRNKLYDKTLKSQNYEKKLKTKMDIDRCYAHDVASERQLR